MSDVTSTSQKGEAPAPTSIPLLRHGDRLTRDEFERRYEQMPHVKKAELIEGVVYMPSPVSGEMHGDPHADLMAWSGFYRVHTPGVKSSDNATVRLDSMNEPQPDASLRILPEFGGQSRIENRHITLAPEWLGEISVSSTRYDLREKKEAYRRNNVREYVVWRVEDEAIDWFILRDGVYENLQPGENGIYRSEVFPGLWLDAAALVAGNMKRVMEVLQQGLDHPSHAKFVELLEKRHNTKGD